MSHQEYPILEHDPAVEAIIEPSRLLKPRISRSGVWCVSFRM
jgi:hypothetical protein